MSIFNFLRKKKKKINELKEKSKKIRFLEIDNFSIRKRKEIDEREKKIFALIGEKISIFSDGLKIKINEVERFDVEYKKAEEKIKVIVNEGRKKYIKSVEYFLRDLKRVEKTASRNA